MTYSPIALFVYNRPQHTRQTVEALQKNALAIYSDLIIFSDAPKNDMADNAVREVRNYIKSITGFKSVSIVERLENFGLARSIIDGVTSIVNERGRIIVLEDDLITSQHFLTFMNDGLDAYQDNDKVMHISGYMFPIDTAGLPETFFLRTASCWGWATWSKAWKYFDKNAEKLVDDFSKEAINRFNMDGAYNFWAQVEQNKNGMLNTWAIFWYTSIFQLGGLCLHPRDSMVDNIGHDATGEHCAENGYFAAVLATERISFFEKNIAEHTLALARTKNFFLSIRPSLWSRIIRLLKAG